MSMVITGKSINRRTLLKGPGAVLALPLLDAMTPAFAVDAVRPTRLAWFHAPTATPDGTREQPPLLSRAWVHRLPPLPDASPRRRGQDRQGDSDQHPPYE